MKQPRFKLRLNSLRKVPPATCWALGLLLFPVLTQAGPTFPDQADPKAAQQGVSSEQQASPALTPQENPEHIALQAEIRALEVQRAELLARYAPAHPDVRALDRKLQIRRKQLEQLKLEGSR